jgi:hypothetical protein
VKRKAPVIVILVASALVTGCGVTPGGAQLSGPTTKPDPDVNLSARPCSIQTLGLLNQSQVPPNLTPTGPASSEVGPQGLLDSGTDGSVGNANEYFKAIAFVSLKAAPANQVSQFAEEVTDYGTVATAERWMTGQEQSNKPNDIPMYGNGVERVQQTPTLGDETLLYQIDDGAPYNSSPFTGPFVGHIYTDIQVRDGDVIYALSIDSGPDADPASLAVSLVRALIAKEHAVCG